MVTSNERRLYRAMEARCGGDQRNGRCSYSASTRVLMSYQTAHGSYQKGCSWGDFGGLYEYDC